MARPRADTGNFPKEPHSVSLKVLRLSRPSLALQHPLPHESETETKIPHISSLAYPSKLVDQEFIISNNLALPPSFGSAHVGETFSCVLCANNELLPPGPTGTGTTTTTTPTKTVSGTKILAEMQTPSQSIPLDLHIASPTERVDGHDDGRPGSALQTIARFDLKEEGNHVLAVNVTYTETISGDGGQTHAPTSGRVRSFRKLYQFLAQPCLSVRTKATELPPKEVPDKTHGPYGRTPLLRYALEAQLENVSDITIVLEEAKLQSKPPFKSTSLNYWDAHAAPEKDEKNQGHPQKPIINPRDIIQIAFLVEQMEGVQEGIEDLKTSLKRDGRAVLGQLAIQWRSSMGERGSLSTGNLLSRRRVS
ncbi:hypothetical protein HRR83_000407 [Exophiala dermatitidis]|uniref:Uncharacterized protein n=1 Tax=Exophiala dermatitidis TaxID=5970 RepID=A0AAN6F3G0_EXODE|nr:hypothetical protein HRR74_000409 [Exophiala dermatitidis]KAJ4531234.1 hypothetical protein HRR76_008906 [Exophiala dermatitidis]KAJ4581566.1 hypothetical protein HRR79_000586 [Exophiala dermatitidis]KAJ4584780.1 hypothetical protein HRR81_000586 [Exophiala dermatitidis]KAJ4607191.1 hypothetical protein HRR84_000495 [Exophiala dermatitidis]